MAKIKGIDVSRWQSAIDWNKVKADGVKFAMIRCGTGAYGGSKDAHFEYNYSNAKAAGIAVGAYFYSYALTVEQAKKEAQNCLAFIKGKKFEYPVVFDIEDKTQRNLGEKLISDMIRAFCEEIKAAGYIPCIYANKDWLDNRIDDDCKNKYDVWLAQWSERATYTGKYKIWQYTSSGSVNGISGNVDMNISLYDYAAQTVENSVETVEKSIDELAKEVLNGVYGNGEERKKKLGSRYAAVQKRVNEILAEQQKAKQPPKKGDKFIFNRKPLYVNAYVKENATTVSGTYYLYDGKKINGRYRITYSKELCGKKPIFKYVTGFVEL